MRWLAAAMGVGACALASSLMASSPAFAQEEPYPAKELRVICAFPAGSGADVWVRFFAEQVRPLARRPVIVENKPGASGQLATTYVAKAKPDGYTLFIHSPTSLAANLFMFKTPPVDPRENIVTVATLLRFSFYLAVDAKRPWRDVNELVTYVRERGDKASYATTAPPGQLMGALFRELMGLKAVEIPYRTAADSIADMVAHNVDYGFYDGAFIKPQAASGRLRILAIGSRERMKSDPNTPTLQEFGAKGLDVPGFFGVMVPKGTPESIQQQLNDWFVAVVNKPEAQTFIKATGADPLAIPRADAQKLFLESVDEWGRLVKLSKIEPKG